jgi:hypothetical protein
MFILLRHYGDTLSQLTGQIRQMRQIFNIGVFPTDPMISGFLSRSS